MTFGFIRALFVLICMVTGFQLGSSFQGYGTTWGLIGIGIGLLSAFIVIWLESAMGKLSLRGLSAAVFGLILAMIVSKFIGGAVDLVPDLNPTAAGSIKLVVALILCYFGMIF